MKQKGVMMAKDNKKKSVVNLSLLAAIASGSVTHVSQADGLPLVNNEPPLISVDVNDLDGSGNARATLTDAGKAQLPNGNAAKSNVAKSDTPVYAIINNATLPEKAKRRGGFGGGAPTVYPWATMEVGNTFFVPVSEKHPDPIKSMTSAVSSANMKYSEPTGEKKTVERTKRGSDHKAVLDAEGHKIKEMVERDVMRPTRKFNLASVKKGETYGTWVAEADGVLIGRVS